MKKKVFIVCESTFLASQIKSLPFYNEVKTSGGEIFVVGGAVRDDLIGKTPKDLDIMIRGIEMDQLIDILKKYGTTKTNEVGGKQAIIIFKSPEMDEAIEIALPRTEKKNNLGGYKGFDVNVDHKLSPEDDAKRRDLTINSMMVRDDGNLVDPFGGKEDIKNKIIRATSETSFSEDPLRMLRAIQFATRFGYTIEPKTFQMIKDNAQRIAEITKERYLIEFEKLLSKGDAELGISLLIQTGLFQVIFNFEPKNINPQNFKGIKDIGDFFFLIIKDAISENELNKFKSEYKLTNEQGNRISALYYLKQLTGNNSNDLYLLFVAKRKDNSILKSKIIPKDLKTLAKQYPLSIGELAIGGQDLIDLNVPEKERGTTFISILKAIYANKIENKRDQILNFLKK